ncbi:16S rRNA (cytidine(1402)-2'-O)-methyltransferase [Synergistaceae bacterium OttesenSCG-928-D05]|nr:16S rRNA (cytidine(1402)-2'-O)-methyltransferase [Synergistaceae bacterium OttesenSCG-928-D05]
MPLIIVPTPIGNLEDMTLRGLRALREADVIACEDTRRTLKLLNHFEIKKPLISYHEHNELARVDQLIERIEKGETVALVSDAGTPGLSDPGGVIAKAVIEKGLPYDVLPGANALLPALLLSGFEMENFCFVGFLKGGKEEKKSQLEAVKNIPATLVFYLSPHKLIKELALMGEVLGDRRAALVREISKIHQETIRASLLSFADAMPEEKIKGEFVCVIEGAAESENVADDSVWMAEAQKMCRAGESTKNVANLLAVRYCIPRNRIKRYILENCTGEAE